MFSPYLLLLPSCFGVQYPIMLSHSWCRIYVRLTCWSGKVVLAKLKDSQLPMDIWGLDNHGGSFAIALDPSVENSPRFPLSWSFQCASSLEVSLQECSKACRVLRKNHKLSSPKLASHKKNHGGFRLKSWVLQLITSNRFLLWKHLCLPSWSAKVSRKKAKAMREASTTSGASHSSSPFGVKEVW